MKLKQEESLSNLSISVKISDSARPTPNSIVEDFSVFFIDQTANELLSALTYDVSVDKNTAIGSVIGNLMTFVPSKRSKYLFAFEEVSRIQELPFYLNAVTGEIFLVAPMHRDISSVEANIQSIVGDTVPLSVLINFKLSDKSDGNRPSFDNDPIFVEVEVALNDNGLTTA